jgi:L-alanine-DL-glutamate epimerase-like enolase superfamily enzyme
MKITKISTLCMSRPHELERQWVTSNFRVVKADCAIVVVETDEGVTGVGEACAYGGPLMMREWVNWYSPLLIGQDPTDARIIPRPHNRSWSHDCAVGGVDSALWDLKGKVAGKRVSQLLKDKPLDKVRLYASSGCRYDWRKRPSQLIDEALEYIASGYTAMKFRIGTEWKPDAGICGISAVMQIAEVAHNFGVGLCPHNWHNGLMTMANANCVAALPNPKVLELCMIQGPLQWEVLRQMPTIKDGYLVLPDKPGLGVDIPVDLEQRFPYIEGGYALTVER